MTKQKAGALRGISLVRKYREDKKAVSEGVWRDYADGAAKLLIARFNNPGHSEFLRAERKKHSEILDDEARSESPEATEILVEMGNRAMAKFILKGWEGILDEDGETPLPFSEENAYALLSEFDEFSAEVFRLSTEVEQYRLYKEADAVKN
ncbi:hypothetical protein V9W64_10890 [Neisseria leonii]|uniref:Uncharacterized protein n=1 Tax=Neisseria leonii TaxID=2995413 RepID=A0A9X4DZI7_9NEIS|nr:hypothetical protein [Neisseria sp. 51.81]MDD9326748.1 hypothetical protein [Neisseria sp. 51.81]